jgi:2'-5' RNA ligase
VDHGISEGGAAGAAKRLFIAADVDDRTRDEIGRISSALREAMGRGIKASWVHPDRMHLTLHFFAAADRALEQRIVDALAAPVRRLPFDVSFDTFGFFPERGSPRVLWLGIRQGVAELQGVQQALHEGLRLPRAEGPFKPHLTLARFRDRVSRAKFPKIPDIRASAGPCRIDRVTLYESRLSPKGPTYFKLAEAPLRP